MLAPYHSRSQWRRWTVSFFVSGFWRSRTIHLLKGLKPRQYAPSACAFNLILVHCTIWNGRHTTSEGRICCICSRTQMRYGLGEEERNCEGLSQFFLPALHWENMIVRLVPSFEKCGMASLIRLSVARVVCCSMFRNWLYLICAATLCSGWLVASWKFW